MEVHYSKHHQTYVNNLVKALEDAPQLKSKSLEEICQSVGAPGSEVSEKVAAAVRNSG